MRVREMAYLHIIADFMRGNWQAGVMAEVFREEGGEV